ncbi:26S proteasome non-ATPase regulatory subunit 8 [Orchesella cincta]|uniref:26S proteasome non-ATPase regulatory subunit 8 n=1 Tax=Orchesella cincta TaxID=48709 RepID=A0A1D2NLK5_ORCCI|nr:26S proteasome non-ATPase regulatory subunit 8 [Orchesella cincta]
MGSLQEAIRLRQQLAAEWNAGRNPNLDKCGELLNRLKIVLTHLTFLPESTGKSSKEELLIARDVLEIGAFWSIAKRDIPSFERYIAQLKCYYLDFKEELPESSYKCELLGLNLLCLLSQNRVAEFHTELELFAHPDVHILENVYIKHAVSLEQYLMEGRYNKIFLAKRLVPAEAYNFFIDILLETIRDEIAICVEKSYTGLNAEDAAKVLNISGTLLHAYATKRGWTLGKNKHYYFHTEQKQDERIPSYELAKDAIEYAKELEMIV